MLTAWTIYGALDAIQDKLPQSWQERLQPEKWWPDLGWRTWLFVAVCLFLILFAESGYQNAKKLTRRIDELSSELNKQNETKKLRSELWILRTEGVQLRNNGTELLRFMDTPAQVIDAWWEEVSKWHERLLGKAGQFNEELRNYIGVLDRVPYWDLSITFSEWHRTMLNIVTEKLSRLESYLSRDLR